MFTPAFGAISDATGLVNRFDIETSGHVFEITTTSNFDVSEIDFDADQKKLTLRIVSSLENNLGEIIIPRGLLSGNFTFYLNEQEHFPDVKSNERIAFITLNFTGSGNNQVDVFATNHLEGLEEVPVEENVEPDVEEQMQGGGCLIATATYGSELAPQVQQLREIRDTKLLQTESGKAFVQSFNDFYYSFSPVIADYERENPLFKESVKLAITPMISSLSILNYVDMDSEIEVIGYGTSIILLNLGMYFAVPALIAMRVNRF